MITYWRPLGTCHQPKTREEIRAISFEGWNPWQFKRSPVSPWMILLPNIEKPEWPLYFSVYCANLSDGDFIFAENCNEADIWSYYIPASANELSAVEAKAPQEEGFWRSYIDEQSELPWPVADDEWSYRSSFLEALEETEKLAARVEYRGHSQCRICGCLNGSESFRLDGWEWPSGFHHYVEKHHVRPTETFASFIFTRDCSQ